MHLSMLSKHSRPHISACISVSFQTWEDYSSSWSLSIIQPDVPFQRLPAYFKTVMSANIKPNIKPWLYCSIAMNHLKQQHELWMIRQREIQNKTLATQKKHLVLYIRLTQPLIFSDLPQNSQKAHHICLNSCICIQAYPWCKIKWHNLSVWLPTLNW